MRIPTRKNKQSELQAAITAAQDETLGAIHTQAAGEALLAQAAARIDAAAASLYGLADEQRAVADRAMVNAVELDVLADELNVSMTDVAGEFDYIKSVA